MTAEPEAEEDEEPEPEAEVVEEVEPEPEVVTAAPPPLTPGAEGADTQRTTELQEQINRFSSWPPQRYEPAEDEYDGEEEEDDEEPVDTPPVLSIPIVADLEVPEPEAEELEPEADELEAPEPEELEAEELEPEPDEPDEPEPEPTVPAEPTWPSGWSLDEPTQPAVPTLGVTAPRPHLRGAYTAETPVVTPPPPPAPPVGASPAGTTMDSGPPTAPVAVFLPKAPWWRRQTTVILGAAALVVLVGALAFVVLGGDDSPTLTYQGQSIDDPESTLVAAERTVADIVDSRHGASNDQTRCYFSLPNADTTDVQDFVRCGPVLFVDGHEEDPYLTFTISAAESGKRVKLTADQNPQSPEPASLARTEALRRPDDAAPPKGAGGLKVPLPPRAEKGLFGANALDNVQLETADADAVIVSYSSSYRLTAFGEPERFGSGDDARRPARGEKLVAFRIGVDFGEAGMTADGGASVAIQIGDAAPVALTDNPVNTLSGMLLSVPDGTDKVELVVTELGVEQRLSLLDGTPGPNNVSVLRRPTREQATNATAPLTFSASRPGFVTESFSVEVGVSAVRLFWFFGTGGTQHPSGPNRAWLVPETSHMWGAGLEGAGPGNSLDPQFFKLTLADGTTVPASNLATEGRILIAFDVPADFTQGTLTVGGVASRSNGETWDFGTSALQVPINIP